VVTRGLAWAGLALFVYLLLTRLCTLAVLAGTWRGLRGSAAVRIRASRIAVETLVAVTILGAWATSTLDRGSLDWDVGGSGWHLELAGAWFVVGAIGLVAAVTFLLLMTGTLAFVRAADLRDEFPRSSTRRTYVLRLALMNPGVVFISARRPPLVWAWTETRAAALGVVATLTLAAVDHELPAAGSGLSETIGDATEEFELEERLAGGGRALTWNELLALLAAVAGVPPAERGQVILPPAEAPIGARGVGYAIGLVVSIAETRRTTRRTAMLARFDERASIRAILVDTPGQMASAYLKGGLDGLLDAVRGEVFDSLKWQLPRRQSRQLTKAYRRAGMEGAAAWMIEKIASYPELLQQSVHAELDRHASLVDSIVANIEERGLSRPSRPSRAGDRRTAG
jgi:hypothetical protein